MAQLPSLIETMRYDGRFVRLADHLARLETSAGALGYPWRPELVRRALHDAGAGREGAWRVRLLLAQDGRPSCEVRRLEASTPEPVRVTVAPDAVDGSDPWRRHKTTRRARYDAASAEAARLGLADVLFRDDHGYLVEGAVSNVFLRPRGRAEVVTPPVTRGALPGVLRARLLMQGRVVVEDVPFEALADADELWIGSSLRGLRRAHCVPGVLADPAAPT